MHSFGLSCSLVLKREELFFRTIEQTTPHFLLAYRAEGRQGRKYTHKHVKRHRFRIEMDLEGSGGGSLSPPLSMNNNNNNGKGGGADTTLSTDNDAKEITSIIPSRPMHAAMSNPFVDGTGGGGNDNEYIAAPGASMQNSVYTTRRFAQRAAIFPSTINQQQQQQRIQQNAEKGVRQKYAKQQS